MMKIRHNWERFSACWRRGTSSELDDMAAH